MFKRIKNLFTCWMRNKTEKLEESNLQLLVDNLGEEKSKAVMDIYNKLVDIDMSIKQLKKTHEKILDEMNKFEELTQKAIASNDEDKAATYAMKYKNCKIQYDRLSAGLAKANEHYNKLTERQSDLVLQYDQRISDIKIKMTNLKISEQLGSIHKISGFNMDNNFDTRVDHVNDLIDKKNDHYESELEVADVLNLSNDTSSSCSYNERKKSALDEFKQSHSNS